MIQIGGHKTQNSIGWASVKDKIKIWRTHQTAHLGFIPVIIFWSLSYTSVQETWEWTHGGKQLPSPPPRETM